MTEQERKKLIETASVKTVLQYLHLDDKHIQEDEQPDFRLLVPNHFIGIEVTRIVSQKNLQIRKALWEVSDELNEYFDSLPEKGYFISCHIKDFIYEEDCKIKIKSIKKEIIEEVKGLWNKEVEEYECRYVWIFTCLHINEYQHNEFNFNEIYFCSTDIQNQINHCVKEKDKKLCCYKKLRKNSNTKEYWLVINIPSSTHLFILGKKITIMYPRMASIGFS